MVIEQAMILLLRIMSILAPQFALYISKLLVAFASLFKTRMFETTQINIKLCFPELKKEAQKTLVKESLINSIFLAFEFAYMASWSKEKLLALLTEVEGRELLDRAMDERKGVIILVPHFGNFEFMEVFLASHYDFAALYSKPKIKALDRVLSNMRERHGGKMFATNGPGLRGILNTLKEGGVTAILPDQVPGVNSGVIHSSFFGNSVRYMSLVHRLIQTVGPNVVIASVTRITEDAKVTYKIRFEEPPSELYSSDRNKHGKTIGDIIEKVVLRSPEQYQWEYKIFKDPSLELLPDNEIYRRQ